MASSSGVRPILRTWTYLGLVWSFGERRDPPWQKDWRWQPPAVRRCGRRELHYIRRLKNYFITLSIAPARSRLAPEHHRPRPEGPLRQRRSPTTASGAATLMRPSSRTDDGTV